LYSSNIENFLLLRDWHNDTAHVLLVYNKIFARLPILRAVFVCFYTLSAHKT